jgi:hypothetical protein
VSTVYTSTGSAAFPTSGTFSEISNSDTTSGASALQRFAVAGASGTSYIYHGAIGGGASGTGQYVIGRRTGAATYAESLRIDSSGVVDIKNVGSAASPSLIFGGDADTGLSKPLANTLAFSTFGLERIRIDSSGNVGIGTGSPVSSLEVWVQTVLRGVSP